MALAGAICGAAALVIGIVTIVGIIALTTSDSFQNYRDCLDKAGSNQAAQTACETQFKHDLVGE